MNLRWIYLFWRLDAVERSSYGCCVLRNLFLCTLFVCCLWCVTYLRFGRRFALANSFLAFRIRLEFGFKSSGSVDWRCSFSYNSFVLKLSSRSICPSVFAGLLCCWLGFLLQIVRRSVGFVASYLGSMFVVVQAVSGSVSKVLYLPDYEDSVIGSLRCFLRVLGGGGLVVVWPRAFPLSRCHWYFIGQISCFCKTYASSEED